MISLHPPLKCINKGNLIRIFDISGIWKSLRETGDFDVFFGDVFRDVHGCCLAFDIGIDGDDYLRYIGRADACEELSQV